MNILLRKRPIKNNTVVRIVCVYIYIYNNIYIHIVHRFNIYSTTRAVSQSEIVIKKKKK